MKTQKFGSRSAAVLVAAMAVSGTAMVEEARAAIIIDIQQVDADVVATISGSWNDAAGNDLGEFPGLNAVSGGTTDNIFYASSSPGTNVDTEFFQLAGPLGFWGAGAGLNYSATSAVTNIGYLGLNIYDPQPGAVGREGFLALPKSYETGTAITGSLTWAGQTMAGLDLDNYGAFTYASGSDSITVNLIGTPSAIPGAGLASVASVGLAGLSRRRRR